MQKTYPRKPLIRKLGTIGCNNIVETTPIVFHGELYRFEAVRRKSFATGSNVAHWSELSDSPCLRFIHVRSNASTPLFAEDHTFGFPFVVGDQMHVVTCAGKDWGSDTLHFFRSRDLEHWEMYSQFHLPGWRIYNMNVVCKDGTYTLLLEIDAPLEECGPHNYTFRFARSSDLINWQLLPWECAFQRDRYAGSPALYTLDDDPHYYVGYLEAYPGPCYANCLARSTDLIHWEYSPVNPVLMFDDQEDKKIGSPFLTPEDRVRIRDALNINNSDMELCEYLGRTIIYYSWGDQMGTEFLAEAAFEGTMRDFLTGFFEA